MLVLVSLACDNGGGGRVGPPLEGPTARNCTCTCDFEGTSYYYTNQPASATFCTDASNREAAQLLADETVVGLQYQGFYNVSCDCECSDTGQACTTTGSA